MYDLNLCCCFIFFFHAILKIQTFLRPIKTSEILVLTNQKKYQILHSILTNQKQYQVFALKF